MGEVLCANAMAGTASALATTPPGSVPTSAWPLAMSSSLMVTGSGHGVGPWMSFLFSHLWGGAAGTGPLVNHRMLDTPIMANAVSQDGLLSNPAMDGLLGHLKARCGFGQSCPHFAHAALLARGRD